MPIDVLQVSATGLACICLGGFAVLFSMIALFMKETMYINEVVLGTGFGVLMGPYVANVFNPRSWGSNGNEITIEVIRIILAIGLFSVGVELPPAYMKKHAKGLLVMVVPTMAVGWVIVSAILRALFPGLDEISALCIAACLTPTDPVTCTAITRLSFKYRILTLIQVLLGGKYAAEHVPEDIRFMLSAESAANDGLAYPFLSIAIYLTVETSTRAAIGKWFLVGILYQTILGATLGAVLGFLFSKLLQINYGRRLIDRESYIVQFLALAIFTSGIASSIGVDDLLAAFAAGCAISWDSDFHSKTEKDTFASVIDYVLNCGCFIYIGAWLPFDSYNSPELGITPWRLVVLMIAVLILRRIPALLLLYRWVPEIASLKEALFCGHFGPMGVSAVFVSTLARTSLPIPADPPESQAQLLAATIQPIVTFTVLGSIIVHGLSIPAFSLGRGVRSLPLRYTRTRTITGSTVPDWKNAVDIERGIESNDKADNLEAAVVPDRADGGLHPQAGSGDETATEHTEVVEEDPDDTKTARTVLKPTRSLHAE